jgi:hypothetical protein
MPERVTDWRMHMLLTREYYNQPVRVMYRTARGTVTRFGSYALIERMRASHRLIAAWSTSTGKGIA